MLGCHDYDIRDNIASGNSAFGIVVSGSGSNHVTKNAALNNGQVDLHDNTCFDNIWLKNVFFTNSGACIQ